jgi:hypothetical protein
VDYQTTEPSSHFGSSGSGQTALMAIQMIPKTAKSITTKSRNTNMP